MVSECEERKCKIDEIIQTLEEIKTSIETMLVMLSEIKSALAEARTDYYYYTGSSNEIEQTPTWYDDDD